MNKKRILRVLALTMALLMLVGSMLALTSCSSSAKEPDYSWKSGEDGVVYFARILLLQEQYCKNLKERPEYTARAVFVAASRGYNLAAEDFDDSLVGTENDPKAPDAATNGGVSLEGAKAALELVKPTDDASVEIFNELKDNLTPEQVNKIVDTMRENVSIETDNGPIDTLLVWIGKFLQILTKITGGNYVVGLLVFALVIEIVMLPFGIKQQKNSIKQAKLRPKEMAIRNKYKGRNDQATQQKMTQEIQKMYQEEGFNPMGGCLPVLVQIPVILALYQIVINPLRYVFGMAVGVSDALATYCNTAKAAGGLGLNIASNRGTIEMLSQASGRLDGLKDFSFFSNSPACFEKLNGISIPNFDVFGINMGQTPTWERVDVLWLIPLLTFVFYFVSMKLTRKFTYQPAVQDPQMGCSNNMMDITMPLMSVLIGFSVPAAVGIYWMFKSVLSTFKSFIMSKVMPVPVFTEEDYKAAEKALKGKKSNSRPAAERAEGAPKPRSLHYIDEDDEPLPPPVPEGVEEPVKKKAEKVEKAEPATKEKPSQVPNLKEDRKNKDNKNK